MKFISTLGLLVLCVGSLAQIKPVSDPRDAISLLNQQLNETIRAQVFPGSSREGGVSTYKAISETLENNVKNDQYLMDRVVQNYLLDIINKLINANVLRQRPTLLLVNKSPFANATCHGEGTISFNLGIVSRAKYDDEIAFILAHEIAHLVYGHVHTRILNLAPQLKSIESTVEHVNQGKATIEELIEYQKFNRQFSQFGREQELQADSLANVLVRNAGYRADSGIPALLLLEKSVQPYYPLDNTLFDAFVFDRYQFQRAWLNERLGIYDGPANSSSRAEIASHPAIDQRVELVRAQVAGIDPGKATKLNEVVKQKAQKTSIEGAILDRYFDAALHISLQLRKQYPTDPYYPFQVGYILNEIGKAKVDDLVQEYLPVMIPNYDAESRALNHFLHNLSAKDCMELAYYYMRANFFNDNADHYRLLYAISETTGRFDAAKRLKDDFSNRFPDERNKLDLINAGFLVGAESKGLFQSR